MPKPRKAQVSLVNTPYYHCVSRCVRRAFLCGKDNHTGQNYEHRRKWVQDRIHQLTQVFCIDVCAYAVMSNHTHLVLHVNQPIANNLSMEEVMMRWHTLYKGTLLSQAYESCKHDDTWLAQYKSTIEATVKIWRQRLTDISWFMRALNEHIARQANKEDKCTGRFWEGRFKSQALLGEAALASCMAYVDLNPIRANLAKTPETSKYTSIQYRINAAKVGKAPKYLLPFQDDKNAHDIHRLPFTLVDYIELVDTTGRQKANNKIGMIDSKLPNILTRLHINKAQWTELSNGFEDCFHHAVGNERELLIYKANQKLQRLRDRCTAKRLFG